jgi:hypothetical protein
MSPAVALPAVADQLGMRRLLHALHEKRTGKLFQDTVGFQEREGISNSDYSLPIA